METMEPKAATPSPATASVKREAKGKEKLHSGGAVPALTIQSPAKQELQATKAKMEALARRYRSHPTKGALFLARICAQPHLLCASRGPLVPSLSIPPTQVLPAAHTGLWRPGVHQQVLRVLPRCALRRSCFALSLERLRSFCGLASHCVGAQAECD